MNVDQSALLKQAFATSLSSSVGNLSTSATKDVSGASDDKNQFRDMLDKKQQQTEKPSDDQSTQSPQSTQSDKPTDKTEAPQDADQTAEAPAEKPTQLLNENEMEARASEWLAALSVLTGNVPTVQNIQPVEVVEETVVPVAVETVATIEPVQEQPLLQQTVTEQATPLVEGQEAAPEVMPETSFTTQLTQEATPEIVQPQQQPQTLTVEQPTVVAAATTPIEQAPVVQQVEVQPQTILQKEDGPVLVQSNPHDTNEEAVSVSIEQPVFDHVEHIPVKVADPAPVVDTEQPQMLDTIADTVQANLTQVGDTIRIQLKPEHLGTITLELTDVHGKIGLAVHAESSKTVELLTRHAGELGALMENRTGREVTVQVQHNQPGEQPNDGRQNPQQQQQEHAQQQQQQQQHPQSRDEQENFIQRLRLGFLDFTAQ